MLNHDECWENIGRFFEAPVGYEDDFGKYKM